jgi:exosortase A
LSALPDPHAEPLPTWRLPFVATVAALLGVVGAFFATWQAMAGVWWVSETFGHGMLVPPIAAWLVWRQRGKLATLHAVPSWWGVAGIAGACAAWLTGQLAGINVVAQFAVVAMVPALVLALAGSAVLRALAFPLAFLFFMVPAGEALNPPLMEATADATIWALQASGIPVFREGLHFAVPTGRWSVVEACSGLRYVIASAVLASLFAHLNFDRLGKQALFVAVALVVAVVANWVRAYLIVLVGHFSDMRLAVGDDHVLYGWVFFGIVMFAVFAMGARWKDPERRLAGIDPAAGSTSAQPDAAAGGPGPRAGATARAGAVATAALLLIAGTQFALQGMKEVAVIDGVDAEATRVMRPVPGSRPAIEPRYSGARASAAGLLDAATGVDFYFAYFARQTDGHEMITFGNTVLPDRGSPWAVMSRAERAVELGAAPLRVSEWRVRRGDEQRLVWSWYTVGGTVAASENGAKVLTVWAMLRGRGDHSAVAVLAAPLDGPTPTSSAAELERATALARDAMARHAPALRSLGARATGR